MPDIKKTTIAMEISFLPHIFGPYSSKPKMSCSSEANWVYVRNGTFRISQLATARHGKILCEHAPIVRGKGDYITEYDLHVKPILSGSPLVKDFFKVRMSSL